MSNTFLQATERGTAMLSQPEYLVCKSWHARMSVAVQQTYKNCNHKLC